MTRANLEPIIRASAAIAEDNEIYVFGSQSILGAHPDAPDELLRSIEADVQPKNFPEREEIIEGSIGEYSLFHSTFGYWGDGVDATVLTLPAGWQDRLVVIQNENTRYAKGLCLDPHDCAVSKLFAGREKDIEFIRLLLHYRYVQPDRLRALIPTVNRDRDKIPHALATMERLIAAAGDHR
jgi:hypothetical protein